MDSVIEIPSSPSSSDDEAILKAMLQQSSWIHYDPTLHSSLAQFLLSNKPTSTICAWISVHQPNQTHENAEIPETQNERCLEIVERTKNGPTRVSKKEKEAHETELLKIAKRSGFTSGKWLIMNIPPEKLDHAWGLIANATVSGDLGLSAKVSGIDNSESKGGGGGGGMNIRGAVICMYTPDFTDFDAVLGMLRKIKDLTLVHEDGIKVDADIDNTEKEKPFEILRYVVGFKADIYTQYNILSSNSKLQTTIYKDMLACVKGGVEVVVEDVVPGIDDMIDENGYGAPSSATKDKKKKREENVEGVDTSVSTPSKKKMKKEEEKAEVEVVTLPSPKASSEKATKSTLSATPAKALKKEENEDDGDDDVIINPPTTKSERKSTPVKAVKKDDDDAEMIEPPPPKASPPTKPTSAKKTALKNEDKPPSPKPSSKPSPIAKQTSPPQNTNTLSPIFKSSPVTKPKPPPPSPKAQTHSTSSSISDITSDGSETQTQHSAAESKPETSQTPVKIASPSKSSSVSTPIPRNTNNNNTSSSANPEPTPQMQPKPPPTPATSTFKYAKPKRKFNNYDSDESSDNDDLVEFSRRQNAAAAAASAVTASAVKSNFNGGSNGGSASNKTNSSFQSRYEEDVVISRFIFPDEGKRKKDEEKEIEEDLNVTTDALDDKKEEVDLDATADLDVTADDAVDANDDDDEYEDEDEELIPSSTVKSKPREIPESQEYSSKIYFATSNNNDNDKEDDGEETEDEEDEVLF